MTSIRATEEDYGLAWLHLWGQEDPHGPALIRANRKALEDVRDAINKALTVKERVAYATAFDKSGEGFRVEVELVSVLDQLGTPPYTKSPR